MLQILQFSIVPFKKNNNYICANVILFSESWVDLSQSTGQETPIESTSFHQDGEGPDRVTPLPFGNGEEYLRLLKEAQKDSQQSSARVSLASSRKDSPRDS